MDSNSPKVNVSNNEYKEVEVFKTDNCFIVNNKVGNNFKDNENKIILNSHDFWEYLELQCNHINRLSLYNNKEYGKYNSCLYNDYKNLTKINYHHITQLLLTGIKLTQDNLQNLQQIFPILETLSLKNCLDENVLEWQEIPALLNMKTLKSLALTNTKHLDYTFIENLLKQVKLETCFINTTINDSNTGQSNLETEDDKLTSYKVLNIGEFNGEESFHRFYKEILINLSHLTRLSIISANKFLLINDFFSTLTNSCSQLKFLSLQRFNIQEFSPIFSLEELELKYCNGFTWNDIRTILSLMKLQTFTSYATRYPGKFEYFGIASSLKHISLQYNIVNNIKTLFSMNEERLKNINSLNWSVDNAKHLWINSTNCPNLKILIAKSRNLQLENLLYFKFLKTLILNLDGSDFKFSDVGEILKHATLNNLTINTINYDWLLDSSTEWTNEEIKISYITLKYHKTLTGVLHLWLSLLNKNKKLSIKLSELEDKECLEIILEKNFLPRRLTSVNICGYIIDCCELKNNFTNMIEKAKIVFKNNQLHEKELYVIF